MALIRGDGLLVSFVAMTWKAAAVKEKPALCEQAWNLQT
jgi:hypothetical protein